MRAWCYTDGGAGPALQAAVVRQKGLKKQLAVEEKKLASKEKEAM